MPGLKRLALPLGLGLFFTVAVAKMAIWATPATTLQSVNSGQHFLPPYANARDRFGFDSGSLSGYDVAQLHAGWYSNWGASLNPAHPDQLVYVQLVRFTAGADPHDPSLVTAEPEKAEIAHIAAAHPGSLWLLGNEPDSYYQGNPILPEVYAVVFHEYYEYIKDRDPAAVIANGGIVQPTPCRLEYLDIVVDTYLGTYGEPIPVDVWNIHGFILREVFDQWGASTPPGVDPSCGIDYAVDDADNVELFLANIRAMRAWMKGRGYQDRPLIITEYGILWPTWFAPQFTPARVSRFMTQTFGLFLFTRDQDLGYAADEYRLVQAWAWYSLSDDRQYNGSLFHSGSKTLSPMGEAFAAFTAAISDPPYVDLSARLVAAWPSFPSTVTGNGGPGSLTFTVFYSGGVGNLGRLSATDVLARFEVLSGDGETTVFAYDAYLTVPARFDGVVGLPPLTAMLAGPERYTLRLGLDPEDWVGDPRKWNNTATTTLDLRPDLFSPDLSYQLSSSRFPSATMALTASVGNQGAWPSPVASATVRLETWPEGASVQARALAVPPLPVGTQADLTTQLAWTPPYYDLYRLAVQLDDEDLIWELDEDNNRDARLVPITVRATVMPTASTVLTSVTGAIELIFPPGAVTMPTEIIYEPLWPVGLGSGGLKLSSVAFSLTAMLNGQPASMVFAQPVTVTWRYNDADVTTLNEARTRLFLLREGGMWYHAACQSYRRDPNQNWVTTAVCRTGRFVFADRYDQYFPVILREALPRSSYEEPALSTPKSVGSPLLLP